MNPERQGNDPTATNHHAHERVIVGKRPVLELVLAAMLADGHVLIEDVPGLAKTLLARTLARTFNLDFSRVQLTPDLLPADLTGTGIWDETQRKFCFQPGPVFCQILLADELNRATPRTQAGLLEAMEERAVTEAAPATRCPARSSCWRRKTPSNSRASSRCPRRRSTAS